MSLTTLSFAFAFLVLIVFYIFRREFRIPILCVASVVYAFMVSNATGISILLISAFSYVFALIISRVKEKELLSEAILMVSITIVCFSLLAFKYIKREYLAIGYSFFCFQSISYLVDVYKGKTEAFVNPFRALLYFVWFPKMVSGPIERAESFKSQLGALFNVRITDKDRLRKSLTYIVVGCLYKMVVADRIAPIANGIFDAPHIYQRGILIAGVILYTIQIYCDFAGYSMVAIGVSNLFGLELTENFSSPYLSVSVTEFWRKWHISLTSWLKDYLYIPLGGNRRGVPRQYINLAIVFIISGIWHGNGIGFLIWGGIHTVFSIIDKPLLNINKKCSMNGSRLKRCVSYSVGWLLTTAGVSFAWFFFKAATLERITLFFDAFKANNKAFPIESQLIQLEVKGLEMLIAMLALAIVIIIDLFIKKYGSLWNATKRIPLWAWCLAMWFIIMVVAIFGKYGMSGAGEMIYMQF